MIVMSSNDRETTRRWEGTVDERMNDIIIIISERCKWRVTVIEREWRWSSKEKEKEDGKRKGTDW